MAKAAEKEAVGEAVAKAAVLRAVAKAEEREAVIAEAVAKAAVLRAVAAVAAEEQATAAKAAAAALCGGVEKAVSLGWCRPTRYCLYLCVRIAGYDAGRDGRPSGGSRSCRSHIEAIPYGDGR